MLIISVSSLVRLYTADLTFINDLAGPRPHRARTNTFDVLRFLVYGRDGGAGLGGRLEVRDARDGPGAVDRGFKVDDAAI